MRFLRIAGLCLGLALLPACPRPEQPQFQTLNNVEFQNADLETGTIRLTADAVFHNPNGIKLEVTALELNVLLDGVEAGTVKQSASATVAANADFALPVQVDLPLSVIVAALQGEGGGLLSGLLAGKQLDVQVDGWVRVKLAGIELKAPVHHQETVELKL